MMYTILYGWATAQLIAVIQVYCSNQNLWETTNLIKQAGYLVVPNAYILPELHTFKAAFYGGLFFSLSLGLGLTFASLCASFVWQIFSKNKLYLGILLAGLAWIIISLNFKGFNLYPSAYFLIVPPLVFISASTTLSPKIVIVHLLCFMILILSGLTFADVHFFTKIRSTLLLTNPLGNAINTFYYDYTLFAAEAFRSKQQKLLRTCGFGPLKDARMEKRLEYILRKHDYLRIKNTTKVDLLLTLKNDQLIFSCQDRRIMQKSLSVFFKHPGKTLIAFSQKTDRFAVFRQYTFIAIIGSLVCTLYLFLLIIGRVLKYLTLPVMVICIIAFWPPTLQDIKSGLHSPNLRLRVAALKTILEEGKEIKTYGQLPKILHSSIIIEQYWLIKNLAKSRNKEAYNDLLVLIDNPDFNISYNAYNALADRRDFRAIPEILNRLPRLKNWYVQLYAYKTLRSLGWKQRILQ